MIKLSHHCPSDGLAPNCARPSAGTVLTPNLDVIIQSFFNYWKFWKTIADQIRNFNTADEIPQNFAAL